MGAVDECSPSHEQAIRVLLACRELLTDEELQENLAGDHLSKDENLSKDFMDYLVSVQMNIDTGRATLSPNSLVVCTPNGFQMKSLMELQLGPSAIPLVKALNKLQAIGYEFTHPPHGIAVSRNEKYFRIRVPRSFAMAHLDSM